MDNRTLTPSGEKRRDIDALNAALATAPALGASWWSYTVSHSTFELLVGDPAGTDNLVIALAACEYLAGPISWPIQHLVVSFRALPERWEFEVNDRAAGFRSLSSLLTWRRKYDLHGHGSLVFPRRS
jgi:hypothetical protein